MNDGHQIDFEFAYDPSQENIHIVDSDDKEETYTKITFSNLNLKHPKTQVQSCVNFLKEKINLKLFLKPKETNKPLP